jgi:orotate phosphoribosyltransferase
MNEQLLSQEFIKFAIEQQVLKFGAFTTKAGRVSPYFFNAGLFNNGAALAKLAQFYAQTIVNSGIEFDVLYGPAYKGITLASATAVALAGLGYNKPFAYNRKEAKTHGEGGDLIGAPLKGRILIIDDVISAGTSIRESVEKIQAHGATPCGVVIAVDRQERGGDATNPSQYSAVQDVESTNGFPVLSIANLDDIMRFLEQSGDTRVTTHYQDMINYRNQYGILAL